MASSAFGILKNPLNITHNIGDIGDDEIVNEVSALLMIREE